MGLFGKSKTPKESVQEWQKTIRQEQRVLNRQIRDIERQEAKVKVSCKAAAKAGDTSTCRILAKEIAQSRKAVNKLHGCDAQMSSLSMQMREQLATIRMTGAIQMSTNVMASMNSVMNVPEISRTMMNLTREMEKAGMIEEIVGETIDDVLNDDGIEEAADAEVENVLYELTAGVMGTAPSVNTSVPQVSQPVRTEQVNDDDISARLAALGGS